MWADASCEQGDFEEYARLRADVSQVEADAARSRRTDRRAESLSALLELAPGDIIGIPAGRHEGWAVVVDPGARRDRANPSPTVMTRERQLKKLSVHDFPSPPVVAARMRIPKHFDPRQAKDRRNLGAAFLAKLAGMDTRPSRYVAAAMDAEAQERITQLRSALQAHPCHTCPDREEHARAAEKALRLERDTADLRRQVERRSTTIAVRFDKICSVLTGLGYLTDDAEQVTPAGSMLARIYSELDLVAAESMRAGLFDELDPAELAAVASSLTYESRGADAKRPSRMPNRSTEIAQSSLRHIWRDLSLMERDHKLDASREPDIGFAEATYAWASGRDLADVLADNDLTAGDFVRSMRMVIDLLGQLADAAGAGVVRTRARDAIDLLRRGVVSAAYDEDD